MKTIYIVRHAKSSWEYQEIKDMDRPLKKRGINDAYLVSSILKEKILKPDAFITSSAIRALSTAVVFCNNFGFPLSRLKINKWEHVWNLGGVCWYLPRFGASSVARVVRIANVHLLLGALRGWTWRRRVVGVVMPREHSWLVQYGWRCCFVVSSCASSAFQLLFEARPLQLILPDFS